MFFTRVGSGSGKMQNIGAEPGPGSVCFITQGPERAELKQNYIHRGRGPGGVLRERAFRKSG